MTAHRATYDAIVVGGGHAGCEAAFALATLGQRTLLLTMNVDTIGAMSCNPAIGGMAKGHLVKEIDALGGLMGRVADAAAIHYKRLNTRKGPAVWSSRAQADMRVYRAAMQGALMATPGLDIKQGSVERLRIERCDGAARVCGVVDQLGIEYDARAVVLTTGTFLRGLCHVGQAKFVAGRAGDIASLGLADQLRALQLDVGRLKTGTTPRLDGRTIDWSVCEPQPGDPNPRRFSFYDEPPMLRQVECFVTATNAETHDIIRGGLDRSPMFDGTIEGIGPRYCPSIEDKIHRFADKDQHQIFLEPQGLDTIEVYPNGISTSLPYDVQLALVRSIRGLERAEIMRPGYAVEYDFVNPIQLDPTLELRALPGLYLAGQINGTSGYEEAAAQGLVAGVNAAQALRGAEPLVLGRDEAYIGVLVDDLTTRGAQEPYRMFTSRAEYRLMLREDNADRRLSPRARSLGMLGDAAWARYCEKSARIDSTLAALRAATVAPSDADRARVAAAGLGPVEKPMSLATLLKRPGATIEALSRVAPDLGLDRLPADVAEAATVEVAYEGYLHRQQSDADALRQRESVKIPVDLDFGAIGGLSNEVREKLERVRPASLGQASRIEGMTPAAVTTLWMFIGRRGGPTPPPSA
ncbi:MAG: tRNA uridine-5-carboxymethylaminomethyl(34) synthesis enzyme MnmG [Myxococcales bacterium]|nr:tRNA uridine-5-carboxymethylaminomethyl(34) synthesis enzyme MnmG [Myxococcales bacterium]MCB9530384.1 tRNA uridine-5-carboxymethylaminomethyl(34) synthesis enzyme MnmG [Myxococcales bacterium]